MNKKAETRTLREGFDEFIRYSKVKNLSEYSITYYQNCFISFAKFVEEESFLSDITLDTVQSYILYQKDENISPNGINANIRGIRSYLYYCMRLGYLNEFKIEVIKAEKKVKEVYTDNELKLLLKKPNVKTCSFTEYKHWVITNYALSTGNRLSTILNIKISDLDIENSYVTLKKTKNKKQQIVPLSSTMTSILIEYLSYRNGENDDYLFCNVFGNKLENRTLQKGIARYNQARGVMKTSMHLYRHTFAKKYLQAGGNIFQLQRLLGHSSLEIVKEYVNLFSEDLKENYDRFNPLEQVIQKKDHIKLR